jgi:hypothetical protein
VILDALLRHHMTRPRSAPASTSSRIFSRLAAL